jgi:hypothetical protein
MHFDLFQWLHDLIDHLRKHPQAETVTLPTLAAVAVAAQPPVQPAPVVLVPPAATGPAPIPLGPVGADGKPTVTFPGGDLATFQAFKQAALAQHGYGITIVNTAGQPLDVGGDVIAPSGSEPDWMKTTLAADGGWLVCNVPSKTYSLDLPGPGHIQIPIAETPFAGTSAPDQVRVTLAGQPSQTFPNVHSAELRADVQGATTLLVELLDSAGNPQAEREVGLSMQFQPTA